MPMPTTANAAATPKNSRRKRAGVLMLSASALLMLTGASNWGGTVSRNDLGAHVIGNPAAKVKLVEYFSYTCSHCADFARDADAGLHQDYVAKGKVQVEYRNLVRDSIDITASLLARCGAPSAFYGNHKAIMASQQSWGPNMQKASEARQKAWAEGSLGDRAKAIATDTGLRAIMQKRGYTDTQLNACLTSQPAIDALQAMSNQGRSVDKVTGTPSFFINGKAMGPGNWATVKTNLDAALNGA